MRDSGNIPARAILGGWSNPFFRVLYRQGAGRVGAGIVVKSLKQRSRFLDPTRELKKRSRASRGASK